MNTTFFRQKVVSMGVDAVDMHGAVSLASTWLEENKGRYICVSNVHMCIECLDDRQMANIVDKADLVVPDGKPIALALKLFGQKKTEQIRGADLTEEMLKYANSKNSVIGFYGGTEQALACIEKKLSSNYPGIKIGCMISPPFRALSEIEIASHRQLIKNSGVQLLFIGLGCPKQEFWMAANVKYINATMIGIGAVFDFLSGEKPMAPKCVRAIGMEWFFRLITEPRRLWKRYLNTNARFLWFFGKQFIRYFRNKT